MNFGQNDDLVEGLEVPLLRAEVERLRAENARLRMLLGEVVGRAPPSLPEAFGGCCEVYLPKYLLGQFCEAVGWGDTP